MALNGLKASSAAILAVGVIHFLFLHLTPRKSFSATSEGKEGWARGHLCGFAFSGKGDLHYL
jgi:hypothetical protein